MDNKNYLVIDGKKIELPTELIDKIKDELTPSTKKVTYKMIANELLSNKVYYTDVFGSVLTCEHKPNPDYPNVALSKEQLENLLELNKLITVARYLNGGWKPNWHACGERKYYIYIDSYDRLQINCTNIGQRGDVYFHTPENAQQAIDIINEESIRKALTRY